MLLRFTKLGFLGVYFNNTLERRGMFVDKAFSLKIRLTLVLNLTHFRATGSWSPVCGNILSSTNSHRLLFVFEHLLLAITFPLSVMPIVTR